VLSDFEIMMSKKKEEKSLKRRKKDIDIINDNDDIISGLINDMKYAAEVIYIYKYICLNIYNL